MILVPSLAVAPVDVLVGYGALAGSAALVVMAALSLLRGRGPGWRSLATMPLALAVAVASYGWLTDTWRSWRHEQCIGGSAAYCNTAVDARPPLWPF